MTELNTVAVLGAGTMGRGIAHVSALAGRDVRLFDLSPDVLADADATMVPSGITWRTRALGLGDERWLSMAVVWSLVPTGKLPRISSALSAIAIPSASSSAVSKLSARRDSSRAAAGAAIIPTARRGIQTRW